MDNVVEIEIEIGIDLKGNAEIFDPDPDGDPGKNISGAIEARWRRKKCFLTTATTEKLLGNSSHIFVLSVSSMEMLAPDFKMALMPR